ncbi:tellurite resistance TerB family protein [Desulfovibrio sp. OttesenSCG-928-C14]|nr:tellurite resistance TerB family protein [Desulfovibrio sp. OttesenSCG-928-C14]
MDIFQNLQSVLGKSAQSMGQAAGGLKSNEALGGLLDFFSGKSQAGALGTATLGGLVGALFGGKSVASIGLGALLAGGGATLWKKYQQRMREEDSASPTQKFLEAATPDPEARAQRLIRAMVFAAKSDGHIDAKEQAAIQSQMQKLEIGPEARDFIARTMSEPLDPALVADGVKTTEEALEIYTLSCAAIDIDHFMERSYLDALAKALHIPDDVKTDLEKAIKNPA